MSTEAKAAREHLRMLAGCHQDVDTVTVDPKAVLDLFAERDNAILLLRRAVRRIDVPVSGQGLRCRIEQWLDKHDDLGKSPLRNDVFPQR